MDPFESIPETGRIAGESGGEDGDPFEAIRDRFRSAERRIRQLQMRNRALTVGMVSAVALAGADWIPGASALLPAPAWADEPGPAESIEAQRLVLLGPDGLPRGQWSVDESGNASLDMFDLEQRERLSISVRGEGYPGLSLSNEAGERRVALGLLPDETTTLVFADGAGIPRAVIGLLRGEAANLLLADAEGVSRIGFGLDSEGLGSVLLPENTPPIRTRDR